MSRPEKRTNWPASSRLVQVCDGGREALWSASHSWATPRRFSRSALAGQHSCPKQSPWASKDTHHGEPVRDPGICGPLGPAEAPPSTATPPACKFSCSGADSVSRRLQKPPGGVCSSARLPGSPVSLATGTLHSLLPDNGHQGEDSRFKEQQKQLGWRELAPSQEVKCLQQWPRACAWCSVLGSWAGPALLAGPGLEAKPHSPSLFLGTYPIPPVFLARGSVLSY